jgi:HAD superfamily hydrolase (TIGR01509 family)
MVKAAIFDLDGTLTDSEVLWVNAVGQYLNDRGHAVGGGQAQQLVYGRSWTDIYESIVAEFPEIDETIDEMDESLREYIAAMQEGHDMIIGGSVALLKRLATTMPVCIVSGSPVQDIESALDLMDIHADVSFILGAEDYYPGKPDPTCFLMAAAKLDIAPQDCVVFEDSCAGIKAAKAAGMKAVALVRPQAPEQDVKDADLIIEDLAYFDIASLH